MERFFHDLPGPIDHVMVTAGRPHYGRLLDMDLDQVRRDLDAHLMMILQVARHAAGKVRPGGTLLFMGGTGGRRPGVGLGLVPTLTAALPAFIASLALELAPVRVNLIAAGFVDTPLSASLLGDQLESPVNVAATAAGLRRTIAGWVPNFSVIAPVLATTDLLATLPAPAMAGTLRPFSLESRRVPFAIAPIPHVMLWSATHAKDPEIAWLRNRLRPLAKSRFTSLAN